VKDTRARRTSWSRALVVRVSNSFYERFGMNNAEHSTAAGYSDGHVSALGARRSGSALSNMEVIELCRTYGHLVTARSRRVLRDHHLVEDVVQNVFVKLMRHGSAVRNARSKLAYLYAVTDRCCLDVLHRWRRDAEVDSALCGDEPSEVVDHRAAATRLLKLLDPLERIIALELADGLTQEEIAHRLGKSRQTVNKKVSLIRRLAEETR
jgi:RNA polymerase sigma factor (sigma-70 family)